MAVVAVVDIRCRHASVGEEGTQGEGQGQRSDPAARGCVKTAKLAPVVRTILGQVCCLEGGQEKCKRGPTKSDRCWSRLAMVESRSGWIAIQEDAKWVLLLQIEKKLPHAPRDVS